MYSELASLAKEQEAYIIGLRRIIHENPELAGQEEKTVALIQRELDQMGVEYVRIPKGGIFAKLSGKDDNGRAVLLRADIDALPIAESEYNLSSRRSCVSKTQGLMHACGHDAHTAMLLGAAKILCKLKAQIHGTVYLCFERGEEGNGHVRFIMRYAEKENIHIDSAFGIHVNSQLKSGYMGINETNMMAASMHFDVSIEGKGGHGSRPDQAANPIGAFADIYQGMQAIPMNRISPYAPLTCSIGYVLAGQVRNVIPEHLAFGGSMRTFQREPAGMEFYHKFKELIESSCCRHNCKPDFKLYALPGIPVVNERKCALLARDAIGQAIGADRVGDCEPWMASESFAHYQLLWPGVFAFLGVGNKEKGSSAPHHSPYFDVDESVLYMGSAAHVAYALAFLNSDIDTTAQKAPGGYRAFLEKMERWSQIAELYEQ